jgi:hypothetical protein
MDEDPRFRHTLAWICRNQASLFRPRKIGCLKCAKGGLFLSAISLPICCEV